MLQHKQPAMQSGGEVAHDYQNYHERGAHNYQQAAGAGTACVGGEAQVPPTRVKRSQGSTLSSFSILSVQNKILNVRKRIKNMRFNFQAHLRDCSCRVGIMRHERTQSATC